jgi:hypothetical protein
MRDRACEGIEARRELDERPIRVRRQEWLRVEVEEVRGRELALSRSNSAPCHSAMWSLCIERR